MLLKISPTAIGVVVWWRIHWMASWFSAGVGSSIQNMRTGCHGATDLSPVCMGAALHFDTWVPNFGVQEFMPHSEEMLSVFPHDYRFERGMMHCGESPGHGVDIEEKLAAKYPYQRAYLPVNRLQHDGTLWNW